MRDSMVFISDQLLESYGECLLHAERNAIVVFTLADVEMF